MNTAEKMSFSFKDFLSKCDQIRCFPRIQSHLLKKSLMENVIFVQWNSTKCYRLQNVSHERCYKVLIVLKSIL